MYLSLNLIRILFGYLILIILINFKNKYAKTSRISNLRGISQKQKQKKQLVNSSTYTFDIFSNNKKFHNTERFANLVYVSNVSQLLLFLMLKFYFLIVF